MPSYRLPCSCGRTIDVTARQAGQTVVCPCGAELEVPTLRGLDELPRSVESRDTETPSEIRQRVVLSLALIAVAGFLLGGYLWLRLPAKTVYSSEQINASFAAGKPDELFAVYEDLKRGIAVSRADAVDDRREFMTLGIEIALAIGVATAIAAVGIAVQGRQRQVPRVQPSGTKP